ADNADAADESKAAEDPGPPGGAFASAPKSTDVTVEKPQQQPQAPVAVVTTAISSMVSTVLNPFAGNSPTMPVESPLPWMMMAAARQEFGRTPRPAMPVDLVTSSADVKSTPAVSTLAATDAPTPVVAIPQTPLLQPLQQLPVVGPLLVTPVVAFLDQI